ncbi:MAG: polyprenyl glycosylphosphotransferase [Acidobacteria bacterium]|nr:MAG: polyprenyl glycosylphosphotransferase [Acidobacteriota bacterium]PYV69060.1 MAG: polyprenyl glycosylphosphotransferase [Acidobacteriota bacterium]PYV69343.1 MAG: polyprenyl glycosylphosphotransferase [Acidobacteriota bacterium]
MIRLFNVYYPIRTVILLGGEALLVWTSFLLAAWWRHPEDSYVVLNYEGGYLKILFATAAVLVFSHMFDLYEPAAQWNARGEVYFRLLLVPGILALTFAALASIFPRVLMGNHSTVLGLLLVTAALFVWRIAYAWLAQKPYLREKVYVLGMGERAQRLVQGLRSRAELGVEVVGWSSNVELKREALASHLMELIQLHGVHRVIIAMPDRRGTLPVMEMLQLRLSGVKIEEATSWLEKISGRIEVENLYPSWLIFAEGFRFSPSFILLRRAFAILAATVLLLMVLPLIPFIVLAIKLDSGGSVLYRQARVGLGGKVFYCYKFRTMRQDAEADSGPTWALDNDPRITKVGKFLRTARLDEIPQLWCVLKGDMSFVGPRPERPEFVDMLSTHIPFYGVRNAIRPGITGWAQIRYRYGNSVEDAKEKLQYDLYYVKNMSLGLDLVIMFQTIKIVLLGRGAN